MTYVNPTSVIGTAVVFIVLSIAVVASRFYVRRSRKRSLGVDDWLALSALFFTLLFCAAQITGVEVHTLGYHSPPAPHGLQSATATLPPIQVRFKKIQYTLNIIFVLVIGSIRLSTLFFYRSIFRGTAFEVSSWALITITSLWTVIFFFTSVFQCGSDFKAFWGTFQEDYEHCFYIFGEVVALAISDVILDFAVLMLPLPFIWSLRMRLKQKLAVSAIFLLGLFSVAAGATRMAMNIDVNFLHHPGGVVPVLGLRPDDTVGIVGFTIFWQLVQAGVALVASNLLTLRPLWPMIWNSSMVTTMRTHLLSSLDRSQGLSRRHTWNITSSRKPSDNSVLSDGPGVIAMESLEEGRGRKLSARSQDQEVDKKVAVVAVSNV